MFWKKKKKEAVRNAEGKIVRHTDLKAKLDKVFSLYIRMRDSREYDFKYFRCISCGRVKEFEQADCGHYFSRTHMATRYSEQNCNAECRYCNRMRADHLVGYRENLIRKIGKEMYDILSWQHNQTKKWSDFELQHLIDYYQDKIGEMKTHKKLEL
jgi:hypothetical protein